MPDVPPCSSITSASCARSRRIVASTASSGDVSGTTGAGRARGDGDALRIQQQAQQILDVVGADDVIEIPLVDRIARMRRAAEDAAQIVGRSRRAGMPVMRTRGTMTSPAVSSPNSNSSCSTWLDSPRSAPCSSDSSTISCSSSGV